MTIDDLKALDKTDLMYAFDELGDEILALVEAVTLEDECCYRGTGPVPTRIRMAREFMAKLESLHV